MPQLQGKLKDGLKAAMAIASEGNRHFQVLTVSAWCIPFHLLFTIISLTLICYHNCIFRELKSGNFLLKIDQGVLLLSKL